MMQFYFLSILLNATTGFLLVFSREIPEDAAEASAAGLSFFETKNFRLVLGILTTFTGIMKLLIVSDDLPVLGDLLPAFVGIVGGACLLYEYYLSSSFIEVPLSPFFENFFVNGRKYLGIACLVAAMFHFLFPRVLFL